MLRCLKGFRANQGLLLAGAVAYYSLLSIVPLLMLVVVALSHVIDPAELLETIGHYLEWLVPGQSKAIVSEVAHFLAHRDLVGWLLVLTMLFFSSLAFTVLENAMCVIFMHRVAKCGAATYDFRDPALLLHPVAGHRRAGGDAGGGQPAGDRRRRACACSAINWSLQGVSGALLYMLGLAGEILLLSSIYLVMPVGRLSWRTR
jgi:membrane protein